MIAILATLEPVQIVSISLKFGMYVSVLLAAGSAINLWILKELDADARRKMRRLAVASAAAGILSVVLQIPLRAAFLYGGFEGALTPSMLQIVVFSPLGTSVAGLVVGLIAVSTVAIDRPATQWVALFGAVLIAIGFTLRGHAVDAPRAVLGPLFAIHIFAASFWVGGFYPLHDMAGRGTATAARTVERFGQTAMIMVGLLVAAGVTILWLLAGNPLTALFQPWGQFLGLKLAVVAGLLALAGLNKLRLTPYLARTGDGSPLRRSIRWETTAFLLILIITATFTSLVAPEHMG